MKEQLLYKIVVKDKLGKVITKRSGKARSLLRQYTEVKKVNMSNVTCTCKDTGGTDRNVGTGSDMLEALTVQAAAGEVNWGTRVGTGTTAVTISDYALETAIAQGVGGGQLDHLACDVIPPVVGASDSKFEVKRIILNSSGADVIVWEIGIYSKMDATYFCCIARDVIGAAVTVPDGGSITVFYYIRVAV